MTDKFASQKEALRIQLGKYKGITKHCKPVGITLKYPVFSDLTPDQLDYYLYWRTTIGTSEFKKAPDGYTWLLVCEIINDPDTDNASRMLNTLCTSCAPDGSPFYPELLSVAIEYSDVFKTPKPCYSSWMADVDDAFLSKALSYPISYIPPSIIRRYVPGIVNDDADSVAEKMCELFNSYDSLLTSKTGNTLRETFLHPIKSCILPFKNYAYLGKKVPLEITVWRPTGNMVFELFQTMYAICTGKWMKDKTQRIPFEEIIANSHIAGCDVPENLTNPFMKTCGALVRPLGTKPFASGPSCLSDPTAAPTSTHKNTLGDFLTLSRIPPNSKNPHFVTSDCEHPCLLDFTEEQFEYYAYWKQSFIQGIPLDTDDGYVNLFLSELINLDVPDTPSILRKLLKVYGNSGKNLISSVLVDYELINGHSFSDYRVYLDKYVANSWIDEFIKGTNKIPLDPTILGIMRSGGMSVCYISEDIPLQTLALALQEVFRTACREVSPETIFSTKTVITWRTLFVGLDYLRGSAKTKVTYINYLDSTKFVTFINKSIGYISAMESEKKLVGQHPKKSFTFLGIDCAKIFRTISTQENVAIAVDCPSKIVFDRDAISNAQSDLAAVTSMMYVPEEENEKFGVEQVPKIQTVDSAQKDPWEILYDRLETMEKDYLSALVESPGLSKKILTDTGTTRTKMEDSINNKSLDCIGDTIIENGVPVTDYLSDIRKLKL